MLSYQKYFSYCQPRQWQLLRPDLLKKALGEETVATQIPVSIAVVTAMATTIPMRNTNRQLHETSNPKQGSLQMGSGHASAIEAMHALVELLKGNTAPSREPTITLLPRPGATPCPSSLTHASSSPSLTEESLMPSLQDRMPPTFLRPSGIPVQPAALPPPTLPPLRHVADKAKSEEQSVLTAAELLKQELGKAKDKALKATDVDESDESMEEIVPTKKEAKGKAKDVDYPKTSSPEVQKKGTAKAKAKAACKSKAHKKCKEQAASKSKASKKCKASAPSKTKVQKKGKTSDKRKDDLAARRAAGIPTALLKKFEAGCARCRWRPFCTRSCWALRKYEL